jgi:LPS-assembly lipoprotein
MTVLLSRRRFVALSAAVVTLTGCGFELRRAPELKFQTLQLVGFKPSSPLLLEMRRQVGSSTTTRVVESAGAAQVILEVRDDKRDRTVVASTTAGQVREIQLQSRLEFSLRAADGRQLIGPTEILLSRDMSYNERDALAKEAEEELLYQAMVNDIAAQVMRRLAAVRL